MSMTTVKIKRLHKRLDSISGLDGKFVQDGLDQIENIIKSIELHEQEDEYNCSIFE